MSGGDLIGDDSEWHNLEVARRSLAAGDRAAAIVALTASLNAGLAEDEAAAKAAAEAAPTPWTVDIKWLLDAGGQAVALDEGVGYEETFPHIARHDPARVLRDVRAGRDLIAAILAEPHDWVAGDEFYSCSQAVDLYPEPGESREPGSGCTDPDRAGQPCDCGRDARVERLLRILAGVYAKGEGA